MPTDFTDESKISVFVLGTGALAGRGLSAMCSRIQHLTVLEQPFEGGDSVDAILKLRPTVAIITSTPDVDVLDVARRIRQRTPTRIVHVADAADPKLFLQAVDAGVAGHLLFHGSERGELGRAIRAVARGDFYITPALTKYLVDAPTQQVDTERLTSRHREVLELVTDGRTNKEIAERLNVGVRTVEAHRAELMRRLGVRNAVSLARYAKNSSTMTSVEFLAVGTRSSVLLRKRGP